MCSEVLVRLCHLLVGGRSASLALSSRGLASTVRLVSSLAVAEAAGVDIGALGKVSSVGCIVIVPLVTGLGLSRASAGDPVVTTSSLGYAVVVATSLVGVLDFLTGRVGGNCLRGLVARVGLRLGAPPFLVRLRCHSGCSTVLLSVSNSSSYSQCSYGTARRYRAAGRSHAATSRRLYGLSSRSLKRCISSRGSASRRRTTARTGC